MEWTSGLRVAEWTLERSEERRRAKGKRERGKIEGKAAETGTSQTAAALERTVDGTKIDANNVT